MRLKTFLSVSYCIRVKAIAKGAAKIGLNKLAAKREAQMAKLRDELARMFTTQGPERDAVARALIGAEEPPAAGWSTQPRAMPPAAAEAAMAARPRPQGGVPGGWRPMTPEQIAQVEAAKRAAAAPVAKQAAAAAEARPQSALEFLASKGGLRPNADLLGILGKNRFLGGHGWVLREGGLTEDKARELLAEAGYITNEGRGGIENRGGGTSTIRDLHEAINDEMRGRKRFPVGAEREATLDPGAEAKAFEDHVFEHFDREGVPEPTGRTRARVLELVKNDRMSPLDAHERAIMEERDVGSNEGLPALSAAGQRGKVHPDPNAAPKRGAQAPAAGHPKGGIFREASRFPGEGNSRATQFAEAEGPRIAALKQASDVRLANGMGLTPHIQHLALAGKSDAEIAGVMRGRLSVDQVRSVREHLGIGAVSPLMRPDEDIPFRRGGAVPNLRPQHHQLTG